MIGLIAIILVFKKYIFFFIFSRDLPSVAWGGKISNIAAVIRTVNEGYFCLIKFGNRGEQLALSAQEAITCWGAG